MTREATPEDVDAAVAAAKTAFGKHPFQESDRPVRAALLNALAEQLAEARHDLVPIASRETHLGQDRLYGELLRTVRQLEMCAELAREGYWLDPVIDTPIDLPPPYGRPDIRRVNEALGPVAVFAASNFPFAFSVLGNDTVSAFATGCPVVLKAHPGHPETSAAVDTIAQAVLPAGALTVLYGTGYDANLRLVQAPDIQAAGFTGSLAGGRALQGAINERTVPIPFFGELGAVNPVLVLPAAARSRGETLGGLLAGGATVGMGQFCTNPGIIFRPADAVAFDAAFLAGVTEAPRHQLLNDRIAAGFETGATELAGLAGVSVLRDGADSAHHIFEISAGDFVRSARAREEVFGPATLLVSYEGEEDLIAAAATLEGSLTASLHCDPADDALADLIEPMLRRVAGRILYAGVSPGVALSDTMVHGGPYPSSTRPETSSVGALSLTRWTRPVAYQSCPARRLPTALDDANTLALMRRMNGQMTRGSVADATVCPTDIATRVKTWR